ncbi:MAG TPA: DUF4012 domain-containing protein [Jatrophihabitans sp.]|nr:DUF4012 domain-containing protein [Jatrophihabitans sp.]
MPDDPEQHPTATNDTDAATPDPFAGPEWPRSRYVRRRKAQGLARLQASRRRSKRRPRSSAKRALLWGTGALGVLVLAALAWLVYSGLRARSDLRTVRTGVHALHAQVADGDLAAAKATMRSVQRHADDAHSLTTGPAWAVGAAIPWLGDPLDTTRTLTAGVHVVADRGLAPLVHAAGMLSPGELRRPDGAFDLHRLQALDPAVHGAERALGTTIAQLRAASGSTWLGQVNAARGQLLDQLVPLKATVAGLGKALDVVPTVLGANGPRTYMVTFENDAEIRATGGIPGAFAIVRADAGKVTFEHFEPDNFFAGVAAKGIDFGRSFQYLYQGAQDVYQDSNLSPHFPYAAQIWAKMWQQKTGGQLDGALIIDPTALSYLLQVTGPVSLGDGTQVTADNVVSLTEQQIYAKFGAPDQNDQRKQYLLDIASAVSKKLLAPGVDVPKLVQAAAKGADEHRLLLWSRDNAVERAVTHEPLGGTLPDTHNPYAALTLTNYSNSKLDYYLHASMDWHRTGCGPTRNVTVTVKLSNAAPDGLPPYVLGNSEPPGEEMLDVGLYATRGAHLKSLDLNGRQWFNRPGTEQGHPVYLAEFVPVPRGKTTTVVFHLTEPAGKGPVQIREQPMINPMTTTVEDDGC